ncbi:MAG: ATP-grasp fold amidoligase family protein [Psychrilyobacter sp.]|uniref:ATP-grasp fold amidoligase family protein n=1 Tax=Psychrilyobacter sp. TaxID=2586924 RepID=UPI003C753B9A
MFTMKQKINWLIVMMIPKKTYIKLRFFLVHKYKLNLKSPKTFNEKIQHRKLYENNSLFSVCADKYAVREYVKNKIGGKYLIPLYLVTKKITEEQYKNLPETFVIKTTNGGGGSAVKIISNKFEKTKYKDKLMEKMNSYVDIKIGKYTQEEFYDQIDGKIIAEKLLNENDKLPFDYKLHCFNNSSGFECYIQVIGDRNFSKKDGEVPYKMDYFDDKWKKLGFDTGGERFDREIEKPKNLVEMVKLGKKLSEDFSYVRVDFYNIDGQIYFGELTFCPFGGFIKFNPQKWDYKLGEMWELKK